MLGWSGNGAWQRVFGHLVFDADLKEVLINSIIVSAYLHVAS
jgi:hypothetical protein